MRLNGMLKVRVKQSELDSLKDRCEDVGVKYTVVLRNMMQYVNNKLRDDQIELLGKE